MRYTYQFEIFKANKPAKVIKSSLSTKLILPELDAMAYCQQKALDMQVNPDSVSLRNIETNRLIYAGSALVNHK